jgi:hypothetical protein
MHQTRTGEPAHAVDHVVGAVQLAADLLDGPWHKLLAQDVQDQFVALVLTLGGRHLFDGTASGAHWGSFPPQERAQTSATRDRRGATVPVVASKAQILRRHRPRRASLALVSAA